MFISKQNRRCTDLYTSQVFFLLEGRSVLLNPSPSGPALLLKCHYINKLSGSCVLDPNFYITSFGDIWTLKCLCRCLSCLYFYRNLFNRIDMHEIMDSSRHREPCVSFCPSKKLGGTLTTKKGKSKFVAVAPCFPLSQFALLSGFFYI